MSRAVDASSSDNEVFLRGRLAVTPVFRDLPSGDVLAVFRLTVSRPPNDRVRVDSIECVALRPRIHRTLGRANPGDNVEVSGSLRRRFFRTPSGPASRYAVEVASVRILSADRRAAASRDRKPASA